MLQITNSHSISLELDDDTKIAVERRNPLFSDSGDFFQDTTYPGKAPLSPVNKRFIASGHLVEADNSVYELPVTVTLGGGLLFVGIFRYKIVKNLIDFTIMVNAGTVAEKAKEVKITDIEFGDGEIQKLNYAPPFDAEDTILNPGDYHYAYIPVRNKDKETASSTTEVDFFINPYHYEDQEFKPAEAPITGNTLYLWRWSPHFKLMYVFRKVLEFLGFQPVGSFFDDPKFADIYIYSEFYFSIQRPSGNNYMPALQVGEFINHVKSRFNLSILFDTINRVVRVEEATTILRDGEIMDLSEFISEVEEITIAERKGYAISLTPFDSDPLYRDYSGAAAPLYVVKVGNQENVVEIPVSTLVQEEEPDLGYSYVATEVTKDDLLTSRAFDPINPLPNTSPSIQNKWPLRLFRFRGMVPVEAGKAWPASYSLDLTESDGEWYRFLNDSKQVRVVAYVPVYMLDRLTTDKWLGLRSAQGHYHIGLPEQIAYQLDPVRKERVRVQLLCRVPSATQRTMVDIGLGPTTQRPDAYVFSVVKAVFDKSAYDTVTFESILHSTYSPLSDGFEGKIYGSLTQSADPKYHTGGSEAYLTFNHLTEDWMGTFFDLEFKVPAYFPQPRLHCAGLTIQMTTIEDGYWHLVISYEDFPSAGAPIIIDLT